jgi:hypothetical protein
MTSIILFNQENLRETLINYYDVENDSYNMYDDETFSYHYDIFKSANILDIEYKKSIKPDKKPYNVWDIRKVGSNSKGENITNMDIRKSYKIVSHIDEYDNTYKTLKDDNDEFYVYLVCSRYYYGNNDYENPKINIELLPESLKSELLKFNSYLIDNFGSSYSDEGKYNFIYLDYSKHNHNKYIYNSYRKWKVHKYETGCFFDTHIDSKMNELHIGTLVLIPPENYSKYTGGNLIVYDIEDETKEILNVIPVKGWQCVFIKLGQKHKILEVTSGTRYSFTSPYCISKLTIENIRNKIYTEPIVDVKLEEIKKEIVEKEKMEEIKLIDDKIKELIEMKEKIMNEEKEYIVYYNEIIKLNKEEEHNFIVICKNFYSNPTPEGLNIYDIGIYNSIFNHFKDSKMKASVKFINTKISINAGSSDDSVYEDEEYWGCDRDYRYNSEDKIEFDRFILNERNFRNLKEDKSKKNYGEYDNYVCYYHSDETPGMFEEVKSEYNDEYYDNENQYNVTCMVVSLK